jgi:GrpB-like predicted nucleotidyltransferase (UPF0157 family)
MTEPDAAWPAWATQPVEIADPDPRWSDAAAALALDLAGQLAPWLVGSVEHVGSTAVPDLPAKPVLDLMAPVRDLGEAAGAEPALVADGWVLVPAELDERPWRHLFVLPHGDRRHAHLHLVERSHPKWAATLAFRDTLRRRPELAREYASIKRAAAVTHRDDREAYTDAKSAFVEAVLAHACEGPDGREGDAAELLPICGRPGPRGRARRSDGGATPR